jgi:hypothetical protein
MARYAALQCMEEEASDGQQRWVVYRGFSRGCRGASILELRRKWWSRKFDYRIDTKIATRNEMLCWFGEQYFPRADRASLERNAIGDEARAAIEPEKTI